MRYSLSDAATASLALAALSPSRASDYADWIKVGCALKNAGASLADWQNWYPDGAGDHDQTCARKWQSFAGTATVASLCAMADEDSPGWRAALRQEGRGLDWGDEIGGGAEDFDISWGVGVCGSFNERRPFSELPQRIKDGCPEVTELRRLIKDFEAAHAVTWAEANTTREEEFKHHPDMEKIKDYKKHKLPSFSLGLFKDNHRKNECLEGIEFMIFDVDHLPDPGALKARVIQGKSVALAFVSPSGDGLKFAVRVPRITDHAEYTRQYKLIAARVSKGLGCELDATSDAARLCFLSHDPELYFNPGAAPFKIEKSVVEVATADENEPPEPPKEWRSVKDGDLAAAIKGTAIGRMAAIFGTVMDPHLPLAACLAKAVSLAGVALSQRSATAPDGAIGSDAARLRILTAGGQVCNTYSLLVAASAFGKDVGDLQEKIVLPRNLYIGTAGSAEGLADAYVHKGNGLLMISEFAHWLDDRHWQAKATPFLTHTFAKGWFTHLFSEVRKDRIKERKTNYCYPNILGYVQPQAFKNLVKPHEIGTGFLGRFIFFVCPTHFGRPTIGDLRGHEKALNGLFDLFAMKRGDVVVPKNYLGDLAAYFLKHVKNPNLDATWKRLINEYGPRLAVMLSVNPEDSSTRVDLSQDHWDKAALIVKWLFGNAEKLIGDVVDGNDLTRLREKVLRRIFEVIRGQSTCGGANLRFISQNCSHGTVAKERMDSLTELQARGYVGVTNMGAYHVLHTPPEWEA